MGEKRKKGISRLSSAAHHTWAIKGPPTGSHSSQATVTDPNQHKTTWQLDARGRPLQETAADGGLYQWARDGNGRVTAFTDPLTRTTSYALDAAGYTRLRSWIDAESGGVILARAYGPDNRLMKEFEVGGLTKVNGKWELKDMEMRDARTDSQTILEFKYQQRTPQ